jgi:hypothetical protein
VEDVEGERWVNCIECRVNGAGEIDGIGVALGHRGDAGEYGELVTRVGLGQERSFTTIGVNGSGLFGLRGGPGAFRGLLAGAVTASDPGLGRRPFTPLLLAGANPGVDVAAPARRQRHEQAASERQDSEEAATHYQTRYG